MTAIARPGLASFLVGLLLAIVACTRDDTERREAELAYADTLLTQLGGVPTAGLERGQRWRMVSSLGAGLPPPTFKAQDLPEPQARGARLLQSYCVQCHWLPAPQMHVAAEWPILVRRMQMRARTLRYRMGEPETPERVSEVLSSGLTGPELLTPADADSLLAYLQAHSLPAAEPSELGAGPEAALFAERCSICHDTPSARAHAAAEWPRVVARMQTNMALMDVEPLTEEQAGRVLAHLQSHAAR